MTFPSKPRSLAAATLATVLSLGSLNAAGADPAGTITVGDDTWQVVPAIQCSVYPGDIVAIAGHAAGNEAVEIVVDHDPSSGLVAVRIKGPDDVPHWLAEDDNVSLQIDDRTVSGTATFKPGIGATIEEGQPREVEGSIEISC